MIVKALRGPRTVLSLALAGLVAVSCGGGIAGDGSTNDGGRRSSLDGAGVSIETPAPHSMTTANSVVVRGTIDSEAETVHGVRVAGIEATSDDGFATFTVRVPLEVGLNRFSVQLLDEQGAAHRIDGVRVEIERRTALFERPMALVSGVDAIYVFDGDAEHSGRLLRVDRVSGDRTVFATDPTLEPGVLIRDPIRDGFFALAVVAGPEGDAADGGGDPVQQLVSIDRFTGGRRVVLELEQPGVALGYDSIRDRILVAADGILMVHPTDGTSSRLIDDDVAGWRTIGVGFDSITSMVLATVDRGEAGEAILAIDPRTGFVTVLADESTGAGVDLHGLGAAIAFDGRRRHVYYVAGASLCRLDPFTLRREAIYAGITDHVDFDGMMDRIFASTGDAVVRIDPSSGAVDELTRDGFGAGPALRGPVAAQLAGRDLLVLETTPPRLLVVDLETAERRELTGSGLAWNEPRAVTAAADHAFVLDTGLRALLRIDLATGARELVAEDDGEDGPLASARAIAHVAATDEVLVLGADLLAYDPATGEHRLIAQLGLEHAVAIAVQGERAVIATRDSGVVRAIDLVTGAITAFAAIDTEPGALVVDAARSLAYVLGASADGAATIFELDLERGDSRPIAGAAEGEPLGDGPRLGAPTALVLTTAGTLLVTDAHWQAVLHVDPVTGDRAIVSR